jgi:hypothetical protein
LLQAVAVGGKVSMAQEAVEQVDFELAIRR